MINKDIEEKLKEECDLDYLDDIKEYIEFLEYNREENDSKISKTINLIEEYGWIDGDHHKTWVIDQILRILFGDYYNDWVENYEEDGEYTWDTGIAP